MSGTVFTAPDASYPGFYFDASRCIGCRACVIACKDYHNLADDFSFRRVYECGWGSWDGDDERGWSADCCVWYVSVACNHCCDAVCMRVCPTGAMHRNEYGFVTVDEGKCIGCGYCEFACPYHAPRVDRQQGHSVKCDGCSSRVANHQDPICVEACPQRALVFGAMGDLEQLCTDNQVVSEIPPLPAALYTYPNLIIRPPRCLDGRSPEEMASAMVLNRHEVRP